MSNNAADNKENKAPGRGKGPSIRIQTAGDIPEEKLVRVASKFAEANEIEDYRLSFELKEDLIGGFIIYYQGSRYDYSVKGQLGRISSFIKQTRSVNTSGDAKAALSKEEFPSIKIMEDLEEALPTCLS